MVAMTDKTLAERLHQRVIARLALSKMTKRDREDNRLDAEAANALDAKDAEIARLRAALNPLALLLYGADHDGHSDDDLVTDPEATPTVGDLRRAARAIRNSE